jgi:hypothetical protein
MNQFTEPSIADGRDLLVDVLGGQWNPQIPILSVIESLPEFVRTLRKEVNLNSNFSIGKHHLGHPMIFSLWDNKPQTALF